MIEVRVTAAPSIVLEGEVLVLWASCSTSLSSVAVLVRSISEGSVSGILVRAQFSVELWNVCFGNSFVNIVAPATTCFTTATLAVLGDMSEVIVAATPAVVLESNVLVIWTCCRTRFSTEAVCMWSISKSSTSSVLIWTKLIEENGAEFGVNLEKGGVNDVLTMLLEVLVDKVTSVE